jgi:hypothetical protein
MIGPGVKQVGDGFGNQVAKGAMWWTGNALSNRRLLDRLTSHPYLRALNSMWWEGHRSTHPAESDGK